MSTNSRISIIDADNYTDYDTFLSNKFDANAYTTSVIKASDHSNDVVDIDVELSKLAVSIDTVNKQIQKQVVDNYELLLHQATGIKELETVLNNIEANINSLNDSLALLSSKHRQPYERLLEYTRQLENLQTTCELLREIHRFLLLSSRLKLQLSKYERDLSIPAMTLYELGVIMEEADLEDIDIVTAELSFISQTRKHIEVEANVLLRDGIETQNSVKMASGLQVFYNMKQMEYRVYDIVQHILDSLLEEIEKAVDLEDIQIELRKNSNTAQQAFSFTAMLANDMGFNSREIASSVWIRMENLMESISQQCIKSYSLEKVLELKKNPITQITYLEDIEKMFDSTRLICYFWRTLSFAFEKKLNQAPTFIRHLFASDYPRLLKLLHDCFSRVEYLIMVQSINSFRSHNK